MDTEATQVAVEHKLVKGHGLDQHAARGVGDVYQVEVALHGAVLARLSVDGDIGIVEDDGGAVSLDE